MAKVRVEWVRLARADFERGGGGLATVIAAQTITASSTPVASAAAPNFAADVEGQDGFARVSGLAGAVNLAWGISPVASETNGVRLEAGAQILIAISTGGSLSIVEAADAPVTTSVKGRDGGNRAGGHPGGARRPRSMCKPIRFGPRRRAGLA